MLQLASSQREPEQVLGEGIGVCKGETVVIEDEPEGSTYLHALNLLQRELSQVLPLPCKFNWLLLMWTVFLTPRILEGTWRVHYGTQLA